MQLSTTVEYQYGSVSLTLTVNNDDQKKGGCTCGVTNAFSNAIHQIGTHVVPTLNERGNDIERLDVDLYSSDPTVTNLDLAGTHVVIETSYTCSRDIDPVLVSALITDVVVPGILADISGHVTQTDFLTKFKNSEQAQQHSSREYADVVGRIISGLGAEHSDGLNGSETGIGGLRAFMVPLG